MGGGGSDDSYQREQAEIARQQLELQKAQIVEPEKKVNGAKQANTDTLKEQALRRGLASAFSRDGVGKMATGGSVTGGTAGKLGG